ncbi:MAG: ribonuclease HII [Magnetococcus sp. WYHC-3]
MGTPVRPRFLMERTLLQAGYRGVVGVDEAGRGPLFGPVVAAAVLLPAGFDPRCLAGVTDSKRLGAPRRQRLAELITQQAQVGWGLATAAEIDAVNIRQATFLAMTRALECLSGAPGFCFSPAFDGCFALVDGRDVPPGWSLPARALVRGDGKSLAVAAASIIAKTRRDDLVERLAERYPGYGLERHKGYPTAEHQRALRALGPTPEHRRTFAPVRALGAGG